MPVSDKKREYASRLRSLLQENRSVLIVECDNVGSKQMQGIRMSLRGSATLMMGKNTTIRKVLKDFVRDNEDHPMGALLEYVVGNTGFVFTNGDLTTIRDIVVSNKVPAPARVGSIAPVDVFVDPGPTGCDPGQTAWFQALNIPTKINKGQIEMISRVHLVKQGDKVGNSEAALLQKLNVKPFTYGLIMKYVYDNGDVFEPAVLDVKPSDIIAKFGFAVSTLAAVCLEIGYPTKASVPHTINNAFKSLVAIALESDYKFPRAKTFEDFLADPSNFVVAAAPAASSGGAAAAAPAKEEEPSEESVGAGAGGGLFGDDEDW
jgi:large subunit ribosomal protein LP0